MTKETRDSPQQQQSRRSPHIKRDRFFLDPFQQTLGNHHHNNNFSPPVPPLFPLHSQQHYNKPNKHLGSILVVWSSSDSEDEDDNNSAPDEEQVGYDGLYEFLTRRTGEQAGESERLRKRNRLLEWMKSSPKKSNTTPQYVQPIRLEDGRVDEELAGSSSSNQPPRTKAKFDQLFAGMPSLDDILSRDGDDVDAPTDDTDTPNPARKQPADDSWFDAEKQIIIQEYQQMEQDMKFQINQQRQEDPDGIPDNAEGIVESIVKQELERMLASVKTARSKETLQNYEIERQQDLDARDLTGATDAVVEQILKEAAEEDERRGKLQAQADEYYDYQQQQSSSSRIEGNSDAGVGASTSMPNDDMDLDDWALERLEEMLDASQNREDDDGSIADILEENIEDLRKQIEKESKKGSIQPQTMKEWQMYRAIATRLAREQAKEASTDGSGDTILNEDDVDEALVARQLDSWREYIEKEDGIRKRAGLASGPKLPFEHLGEKADRWKARQVQAMSAASTSTETKTRRELRRDVNIQAIKAMEDLILKSDSVRAEGLKKELEALKAELEPRDYNDIEVEVPEEPVNQGPVDLSDVFSREEDTPNDIETSPTVGLSQGELEGVNRALSNSGVDDLYGAPSSSYDEPVQQAPPNTPFFSGSYEEEKNPPPPNTPFFSESYEEEKKPSPPNSPFFQEGSGSDRDDLDIENKLGSVDEQKLQAMFRRAGARTRAEQDAIRQEWEAFQQFEKQRRDASGLSDSADDDSALTDDAKLKYDISDVMKDGGDFDADKILSTIGPRPSRKPKSSSSSTQNDDTADELKSDIGPSDVADSVFRSVSAAGGGRGKEDEELQERQRSEFDEYLAKENEMRQNLDRLDEDAAKVAENMDAPLVDPDNADDALSSIGPRPVFKQRRNEPIDERALSDMGGVRSSKSLDDIASDDSSDNGSMTPEEVGSVFDDLVPGWLKKEREAVAKSRDESDIGLPGSDIDQAFDDDTYERNVRQLHEYEQRRGHKQMGIDVSEIFGKRGSDDYVDYTYDTDYFRERQDGWGATNFQARKENLLQYIELDPAEVNSVMEQKESVYATGVSQYLPRINKPFKEFGAIFRLEGVLVDIRGLQQKVWKRVAAEFDFTEPLSEDIQMAAVTRPDTVVREIVFRVNDIVLERKILDTYRRILREEFNAWVEQQGIAVSEEPSKREQNVSEKGSLAMGFEEEENVPIVRPPIVSIGNEAEMLKFLQEKWTQTAKQFGFPSPTNEQIAESSIVPPDIAVRNIFGWSSDQMQIDQVVSAYSIMCAGQEPPSGPSSSQDSAPVEQTGPKNYSENEILELQYMAWKKVAEDNNLESPDPEEVLAAAVLNDPDAVVLAGFGWTEDPQQANTLGSQYRDRFSELLGGVGVDSAVLNQSTASTAPVDGSAQENKPSGPTEEEILSCQVDAWKETSKTHDFDMPTMDRIQMVMTMSPTDAVPQLLLMDYDVDELTLQEITETYAAALKKSSQKYLLQYNISPKDNAKVNGDKSGGNSRDVSGDEIYRAAFDAWTNIAWKRGFAPPDQEQVQFALSVGPQGAIINGFEWTESEEEADTIAKEYFDQIKTKRDDWVKKGYITTVKIETNTAEIEETPPVRAILGVVEWIQSLRKVEMGCGVVSHLEEDQMRILLEYAGLSDLLPPDVRVSHSNGYQRDSQQLLGAALRIERRPDHCVAFDTSPYASVAAHDVEMRSVSLVGPYPRYDLLSADTTAFSFDELTAMNIRRLFGERVYDQPELDMKSRQPETNKRVKTKFDWGDDE